MISRASSHCASHLHRTHTHSQARVRLWPLQLMLLHRSPPQQARTPQPNTHTRERSPPKPHTPTSSAVNTTRGTMQEMHLPRKRVDDRGAATHCSLQVPVQVRCGEHAVRYQHPSSSSSRCSSSARPKAIPNNASKTKPPPRPSTARTSGTRLGGVGLVGESGWGVARAPEVPSSPARCCCCCCCMRRRRALPALNVACRASQPTLSSRHGSHQRSSGLRAARFVRGTRGVAVVADSRNLCTLRVAKSRDLDRLRPRTFVVVVVVVVVLRLGC